MFHYFRRFLAVILSTFSILFSSKSIKIGFMPMAKELAKRGHKIYVVSPYKGILHIYKIDMN